MRAQNQSAPLGGAISATAPEAWGPLVRVAQLAGKPLERFLRVEAASGILLLIAAAIALALANSPWADAYHHFWQTPLAVRVGDFSFERPLEWLVNDALMVIFFFVVGLEIRREIHRGELSDFRRAMLPAMAALGGMMAPAACYLALAGGPATHSGWGVPMATDIAFAVGILTLLGRRVPAALRVLLLALAVIDDLGAIVVIAVFYTAGVSVVGLLVAAAGVVVVFAMQRFGVRAKVAYLVPGFVTWAGIYAAGVHPTIAGVILGLITPVRAWLGTEGFVDGVQRELAHLDAVHNQPSSHELATSLRHVDLARREAMPPSESLIHMLHPWVAFGIMPIFALANAGVTVSGGDAGESATAVTVAVVAGLVVGKPIGVSLAIWLTTKLGWGELPLGITMRHVLVVGVVAGVGFTMALFIGQLAFVDASLLAAAKLGVLIASGIAAALALALGRLFLDTAATLGAAATADEAEASTEV